MRPLLSTIGEIVSEISIKVPSLRRRTVSKCLIRHIGLSNVTAKQVEEAGKITEIVCVQNQYNLAHRQDEA